MVDKKSSDAPVVDRDKCCEHEEATHYGTPDRECHAAMCQCKKYDGGGAGGPDQTSDARGSARSSETAPAGGPAPEPVSFQQQPVSTQGVVRTPENPQGIGEPAAPSAPTPPTPPPPDDDRTPKKKINKAPKKRGRPSKKA